MDVEEIKSSRGKTVLGLLGSLALVAMFAAMAAAIPGEAALARYPSWLCAGFCVFCSVVFGCLLIRPQRLLLTPTGFTVAGGLVRSPKEVLWRDVDPFFVYRLTRGGTMIGYNFTRGARTESTLIRLSRLVGAEGALPKGWPGSPERMVERINIYRAKALAGDPTSGPGAA